MLLKFWLLLFTVSCVKTTSALTVWEFGKNVQDSSVISHNRGQISILEKTKHVHVTVPPCWKVTYVRVEVDNLLTTPEVDFNKHTNTVTISYKLLQNSFSTYDVVARAKQDEDCKPKATTDKIPCKHCLSEHDNKPVQQTPYHSDASSDEDSTQQQHPTIKKPCLKCSSNHGKKPHRPQNPSHQSDESSDDRHDYHSEQRRPATKKPCFKCSSDNEKKPHHPQYPHYHSIESSDDHHGYPSKKKHFNPRKPCLRCSSNYDKKPYLPQYPSYYIGDSSGDQGYHSKQHKVNTKKPCFTCSIKHSERSRPQNPSYSNEISDRGDYPLQLHYSAVSPKKTQPYPFVYNDKTSDLTVLMLHRITPMPKFYQYPAYHSEVVSDQDFKVYTYWKGQPITSTGKSSADGHSYNLYRMLRTLRVEDLLQHNTPLSSCSLAVCGFNAYLSYL